MKILDYRIVPKIVVSTLNISLKILEQKALNVVALKRAFSRHILTSRKLHAVIIGSVIFILNSFEYQGN